MEKVMAQELGHLGTNVHQEVTVQWVHSELVQKAEQGDRTSVANLHQLSRHYEGSNKEEIRTFVHNALIRLGELPEDIKDTSEDTQEKSNSLDSQDI